MSTDTAPLPALTLSWRDRLRAERDRLLSSPRFQRWAAVFPLTQPIARRRARALFDLCAGFVYSQILLACVRLRVFEILAEGPQSGVALAERLGLSREATMRLLDAAASLQLVDRRAGGRYGLGGLGAALLGNPGIAAMIEHHSLLYADLQDPVALLRSAETATQLERYWPYARAAAPAALSAEEVASYSQLMSASQTLVANQVLDAYSLRSHRCLLDVGGGDGSFLIAGAARYPNLRIMLFDLPAVANRASVRFAAAGLNPRSAVAGGDFHRDVLPRGADVISLVRVLHDHDDDRALHLLQAVRRALPRNGVLLLAEPMSGTRGAEPIGEAYFGFYLLAMRQGRPRTPEVLYRLLRRAGFADPRLLSTHMPLQTRVIVARCLESETV